MLIVNVLNLPIIQLDIQLVYGWVRDVCSHPVDILLPGHLNGPLPLPPA